MKIISQNAKGLAVHNAYSLRYFRRKHGISTQDAVRILQEAKENRDKANALAVLSKKSKK